MFNENIFLKNHSHYKIGGPARYFLKGKDIKEIILGVEKARQMKAPIFILGGGTNILFSDEGFNGLILKPDIQFIEGNEFLLRVGAGVPVSQLLDYSFAKDLSGLEWAAGLPGTLGGAIRGNAGSFGGEIKNIVQEVTSLDISSRKIKVIKRNNQNCSFGYRSSIFRKQPFGKLRASTFGKLPPKARLARGGRASEIILEATLVLEKGDKKLMREIIEKNINYRQQKQPIEYPNIGSIFKNVDCKKITEDQIKKFDSVIKTDPFPVIPAAFLISEAGLRGVSFGGAMISPKHPNFIVNVLNAASSDVKNLINLAKSKVYTKFKIKLEEEIEYL